MSRSIYSIEDQKRIILRNPDGTYTHCYKSGEQDSSCETKPTENLNSEINMNNRSSLAANDLLNLSDEELRYIIDTTLQEDYPALLEQMLELFRRYRFFYCLVKCAEMFLFWFLMLTTWVKREAVISMMEGVYKDLNTNEAALLFYTFYMVTLIINLVYYPYGFYSLAKKNVRKMKIYTHFTMFISIMTIFIIYINILFVFIFILRLVLYGFARFLSNLLVSILIIPMPRLYYEMNNPGRINYNTL